MKISPSIITALMVALLNSTYLLVAARHHSGLRSLSGEPPVPELEADDDMPPTATAVPEVETPTQESELEEEVEDVLEETPEPTEMDTAEPTEMPAGGGEPPSNDMCSVAAELSVGDVALGSTVDATDEMLMDCAEFVGGNSSGIWYKMVGTGDGMSVQVNGTFDVEIIIFGGDCDEPICLDGTAGEFFDFTFAEVDGATTEGDIYYVYVTGSEGDRGDFEITISGGDIPENNKCGNAPALEVGQSINGSTTFAGVPESGSVPICFLAELFGNVTSETVWYSMVGTGEIVQLSLFADYDSQISVYAGDSCDALECVNHNDDSPLDGPRSVVAQTMEEGRTYIIMVFGYAQESGDFTLESEVLTPTENDACDTSTPLELGVNVSSSTLATTADEGLPFCGIGSNASSPGVWYSFVGTGNTLEVRLENTYFLRFSVYTGECGDLACAGFSGIFPFTWDSVEGEVYSIFAYGRDTFDILIQEVDRPENDMCEASIAMELGEVYEGTTAGSVSEENEFCGDHIADGFGGVWYTFTGTGESTIVGLNAGGLAAFNFFDTQMNIFSGASCDELTCVGGQGDGEGFRGYENSFVLDTVEGETYHVLVNGFGVDRGDFSIVLLGVVLPENDSCNLSISLELGDTIQGSTKFATNTDDLDFEECGTSMLNDTSSPGVWYSVEGGGTPVQVSVFAQYDMQLTVMSGDSCDTLACVDGTEGNEGDFFNGHIIFDAEEGATYWFYVHGFAGTAGDFELFYETAIF